MEGIKILSFKIIKKIKRIEIINVNLPIGGHDVEWFQSRWGQTRKPKPCPRAESAGTQISWWRRALSIINNGTRDPGASWLCWPGLATSERPRLDPDNPGASQAGQLPAKRPRWEPGGQSWHGDSGPRAGWSQRYRWFSF